eukprot:EG_transcript_24482
MSVTEGKFAMLPALEYLRLMAERGRRQLNKPQNLFSLCSALPTEGVGLVVYRRAWLKAGPGTQRLVKAYHLTRMAMGQNQRSGKAWGFMARHGETSDLPMRVRGGLKGGWRFLVPALQGGAIRGLPATARQPQRFQQFVKSKEALRYVKMSAVRKRRLAKLRREAAAARSTAPPAPAATPVAEAAEAA